MAIYMVERALKGIAVEQLAAAQQAAIQCCQALTGEGQGVRYLRTTFVPEDGRCFCLFEAASAEPVKAANERAKIPFTRIVEAMHFAG